MSVKKQNYVCQDNFVNIDIESRSICNCYSNLNIASIGISYVFSYIVTSVSVYDTYELKEICISSLVSFLFSHKRQRQFSIKTENLKLYPSACLQNITSYSYCIKVGYSHFYIHTFTLDFIKIKSSSHHHLMKKQHIQTQRLLLDDIC